MPKKKKIIKCEYDPDLCDWDRAIAAELERLGLKPGEFDILLCKPGKPKSKGPVQKELFNI